MGRRVAHLFGAALLVLAVGCRSKPLQELDGGTGVIIPSDAMIHPIGDGGVTDVGPATDAGGAIDAPWNVTFAGRRSFLMTSAAQTEGGIASSISHTFTMTLDTDRRIAIIGKDGDTEVVPVEQQTGGVLHVVGTLLFGVSVPAACGGSLLYSALSFTIDPSGAALSGVGRGTLMVSDPVVGTSTTATMMLTGVRDTEPPILTLSAAGDIADPWTPFWVVSSEPLPGQQVRPVLRSTTGDAMVLGAPTGMDAFVRVMAKPARLLRYSDEYRVTLDGVTDLDGNAPPPTTSLPSRRAHRRRSSPRTDSNRSPTRRWAARRCCPGRAHRRSRARAACTFRRRRRSEGGSRRSRCGCRFCPATRSSTSPTGASTRATRSASISWSPVWAARSGR